jgi:uncharacterized membrane protein HdeD (DUF308 family)
MTNVGQSRPGLLHHLWMSALISGVLAVVLGVLILVWPGKSIIVAAVFLGIYLVVSGVAQVIFAFSLPVSAASRILLFVSGAASLVLAVLAFRHFGEGYAILLLAIWIGVGFIFRGVATTVAAVSDRHLPGRGWSIFLGVITILAGIIVLAFPFDSLVTLTLVTGIWVVIIGVMEIISSVGIRNDQKKLNELKAGAAA